MPIRPRVSVLDCSIKRSADTALDWTTQIHRPPHLEFSAHLIHRNSLPDDTFSGWILSERCEPAICGVVEHQLNVWGRKGILASLSGGKSRASRRSLGRLVVDKMVGRQDGLKKTSATGRGRLRPRKIVDS